MFLTTSQISERTGVAVQSIGKAVREGRLSPMGQLFHNGVPAHIFDEIEVERWARLPRKPWRKEAA